MLSHEASFDCPVQISPFSLVKTFSLFSIICHVSYIWLYKPRVASVSKNRVSSSWMLNQNLPVESKQIWYSPLPSNLWLGLDINTSTDHVLELINKCKIFPVEDLYKEIDGYINTVYLNHQFPLNKRSVLIDFSYIERGGGKLKRISSL